MSGWDGHSSGSGPEHEPSEDRGQAAWGGSEGRSPEPPWASAETRTSTPLPPPWGTPPPTPPSPHVPPAAGPSPSPYVPSAAPPSPPPYAPPAPARGPAGGAHRGGRVLAAVAAAAVLGAGAGAGVWYVLLRDGSTGSSAGPATGVTVTTSPPASSALPSSRDSADSGNGASATDPGQDAPASPPAAPATAPAPGYRHAQDPVGYTLDVPEGWTRRQKQGEKAPVVYYDSPSDGRQLQIFAVTEDSPATSLDLAENDPGYGFARQPGYEALGRDSGPTWAELTYRYDDADKGPRQVVDHRFQAADGTLYAIRVSGPATLPTARILAPLTAALNSFCPPGGSCG